MQWITALSVLCATTVGVWANEAEAAAAPGDTVILQAREAARRGDRPRLVAAAQQAQQAQHPLAGWAAYWELAGRLSQASVPEVDAFAARWAGSYVEDRLRNDWLLELGRRRDWPAFARELPRFRMADDREVACYGLVIDAAAGKDVRSRALAAWYAQKDADDGCHLLASQLREASQLGAAELWHKLRLTVESNRPRAAQAAAGLISPALPRQVEALMDSPARYLTRTPPSSQNGGDALWALAIIRMASHDPSAAAMHMSPPAGRALEATWAAAAWGAIARQASLRQLAEASAWGEQALQWHAKAAAGHGVGDDALGWIARAGLRAATADTGVVSTLTLRAIDAMSDAERAEPVWSYWKARGLLQRYRPGSAGDSGVAEARGLLARLAPSLHFYGQLAAKQLGQGLSLPPLPSPLTDAEAAAARSHAGLQRARHLMRIGLRGEGVREWNFSLIGMADRQLLAAAQWACELEIWDRCIATSERTVQDIDLALRYPMPLRDEIMPAARQAGLDPALVYGLIRQESRFVSDARSPVGASGLMQVMPATARWTARRIGIEAHGGARDDRATNLRLGTAYLKLVIDDFGGSLPLATAAYNAGPNRSRRWREGAILEPAAWAETIPIHETRDYVKKVLANAAIYAARMGSAAPASTLERYLGDLIGPRVPGSPEPNKDLP